MRILPSAFMIGEVMCQRQYKTFIIHHSFSVVTTVRQSEFWTLSHVLIECLYRKEREEWKA